MKKSYTIFLLAFHAYEHGKIVTADLNIKREYSKVINVIESLQDWYTKDNKFEFVEALEPFRSAMEAEFTS